MPKKLNSEVLDFLATKLLKYFGETVDAETIARVRKLIEPSLRTLAIPPVVSKPALPTLLPPRAKHALALPNIRWGSRRTKAYRRSPTLPLRTAGKLRSS